MFHMNRHVRTVSGRRTGGGGKGGVDYSLFEQRKMALLNKLTAKIQLTNFIYI